MKKPKIYTNNIFKTLDMRQRGTVSAPPPALMQPREGQPRGAQRITWFVMEPPPLTPVRSLLGKLLLWSMWFSRSKDPGAWPVQASAPLMSLSPPHILLESRRGLHSDKILS